MIEASKGFDQLQLFRKFSIQVEAGERIAIIGPRI